MSGLFPTPDEAVEHFARAFQETAACVCNANFNYPASKPLGRDQVLALGGGYDVPIGGGLYLYASHHFRVIEADTQAGDVAGFAITTGGYTYSVNSDQHGGELVSWHWHTTPKSWCQWPHLHARCDLGDHLATGRVALEQVVLWLILEANVSPLRGDWEELLATHEADWRARRSWG